MIGLWLSRQGPVPVPGAPHAVESQASADNRPVVKSVLEEFVPSAGDAIEMASGRVCLVDGTITPTWS